MGEQNLTSKTLLKCKNLLTNTDLHHWKPYDVWHQTLKNLKNCLQYGYTIHIQGFTGWGVSGICMPTNDMQSFTSADTECKWQKKRKRARFNLIHFYCRPIALFRWKSDCGRSEVGEYSDWRSILTSTVGSLLEWIVIFVADLEVDGEK